MNPAINADEVGSMKLEHFEGENVTPTPEPSLTLPKGSLLPGTHSRASRW